jgi:hypothetical protein
MPSPGSKRLRMPLSVVMWASAGKDNIKLTTLQKYKMSHLFDKNSLIAFCI